MFSEINAKCKLRFARRGVRAFPVQCFQLMMSRRTKPTLLLSDINISGIRWHKPRCKQDQSFPDGPRKKGNNLILQTDCRLRQPTRNMLTSGCTVGTSWVNSSREEKQKNSASLESEGEPWDQHDAVQMNSLGSDDTRHQALCYQPRVRSPVGVLGWKPNMSQHMRCAKTVSRLEWPREVSGGSKPSHTQSPREVTYGSCTPLLPPAALASRPYPWAGLGRMERDGFGAWAPIPVGYSRSLINFSAGNAYGQNPSFQMFYFKWSAMISWNILR